ncbi:MAG: uL15 family ribosomal protein [Thermoplasmata archaeon]|nr:uL15 family ribosomal protein [Thermoplasmata archaeon]
MRKKTKKMRGSHTCGRGFKKKARGAGNKGGTGMAGAKHKHLKWRWGRHGFVHHGVKREKRVINVEELKKFDGDEINLTELGYDKLLGSGNIDRAIKVHVKEATEKAVNKIKEAGGEVITG